MKILIGADPEAFLRQNGTYVSAHGMIPGTKARPHKVERGAVQVDGLAVEFNIDPAEDEEEFITNIDVVMAQLRGMVPDFEVAIDPYAEFTQDYLATQPEEAVDLGCDPDFNAWTKDQNPAPDKTALFRGASGHVHCGWVLPGEDPGPFHLETCYDVIRQLDFTLGLPSLAFDPDLRRRQAYGRAGAFRPKPYGVEYRVLSNKWLSSDNLKRWVFRNTQAGLARLENGDALFEKYGDIQDIINNGDVAKALYICEREGIEVPQTEVQYVAG